MNESGDNHWKRQYSYALAAGLVYIVLLALFTWFFNQPG